MATETLEQRVQTLESKLEALQRQFANQSNGTPKKRGWRWFVGIYADSPDFDEVVRIGEEWRSADRPEANANATELAS